MTKPHLTEVAPQTYAVSIDGARIGFVNKRAEGWASRHSNGKLATWGEATRKDAVTMLVATR